MNGEVYKAFVVNGKKVLCIDTTEGFILKIDGCRYHVYGEDDGTYIDMLMDDGGREYIGKVNKQVADEEEAAKFILSLW